MIFFLTEVDIKDYFAVVHWCYVKKDTSVYGSIRDFFHIITAEKRCVLPSVRCVF